VLPQVGITLDGVSRTNFFLSTTNMFRYVLTLTLTAGPHTVGLAFLNDFYAPPEDRNAAFDALHYGRRRRLRISGVTADPGAPPGEPSVGSTPGKSYEVQVAPSLPASRVAAL